MEFILLILAVLMFIQCNVLILLFIKFHKTIGKIDGALTILAEHTTIEVRTNMPEMNEISELMSEYFEENGQ